MYPEIIVGIPGSGKTASLLNIVSEELSRGTPPDRIGYLAFTRRASIEAIDRAKEQFELDRKDMPYFSTIHSLCFKQLGLRRGDVMEGDRLKEFGKYAGIRVTGAWSEDGTFNGFETGDRILHMENLARVRGVPLKDVFAADDDGLSWPQVERVARALRDFKTEVGLTDFTDMLVDFVKAGIKLNLDVLLVDEVQDLSFLQHMVIENLAKGCRRVVFVGDDDQNIFSWSGSDVNRFIDMPWDVKILGQSHRVPPAVQRVAKSIIDRVKHRREKQWTARGGGEGVVDRAGSFDEVVFPSAGADAPSTGGTNGDGSVLVLARNTYVLRDFVEPVLRSRGVIYERNGHSSLSDKLMHAVRNWEALRKGEPITAKEARGLYELMTVGVGVKRGHKTLPGLVDDQPVDFATLQLDGGLLLGRDAPWFDALDRLPARDVEYLRAALKRGERPGKPRVVVSTIHGAKGAESDHVVLLKDMAARTHWEMQRNPEDEMRVFYVGVTRAKERLTIVEASGQRACPWL